jgi:drug/metabolite transporter (DMT)-like permease
MKAAFSMQSFFHNFFSRPYLLLSLASLFWAGNIVVGRYATGHVPPLALSFIRWTVAFLMVIGFAWPYLKRDWPTIRKHLGIMLLLTVLGISIYNFVAYWALQHTQALNALLLASSHPLIVALCAFVLYREKLTIWQAVGVVISLCGVLTVLTRGDPAVLRTIQFNIGDIVFFIALVIYAIYTTLLQSRPKNIQQISFLAFTMGVGALFLAPAYAADVATGNTFTLDLKAILILGYIALFPSLLAYLCFNRGNELIGANRAAPFYHLIPVFGSALAILFLGEKPELFHAAGYALVLLGILIGTRRRRSA